MARTAHLLRKQQSTAQKRGRLRKRLRIDITRNQRAQHHSLGHETVPRHVVRCERDTSVYRDAQLALVAPPRVRVLKGQRVLCRYDVQLLLGENGEVGIWAGGGHNACALAEACGDCCCVCDGPCTCMRC